MFDIRKSVVIRLLLALFIALGLAACASTGGNEGASESRVTLIVENNLVPSSSLSVYAIPETGPRRRIGSVAPGQTATLRFNPIGVAVQYRLVAEAVGGGEILSNPISFAAGSVIRWDLQSNIATVGDGG